MNPDSLSHTFEQRSRRPSHQTVMCDCVNVCPGPFRLAALPPTQMRQHSRDPAYRFRLYQRKRNEEKRFA